MILWVTVATACSECGGGQAVLVTEEEPTREERVKLCDHIGGMYCITLKSAVATDGEPCELKATDD